MKEPMSFHAKTITTKRLRLRSIVEADTVGLHAVLADPRVMHFSDGVKSPEQIDSWIASQCMNPWMRAIIVRASGEIAGYCGLTFNNRRCASNEIEFGIRLATAQWHQGYATEAASALLAKWHRTFPEVAIIAIVDPGNSASVLLLKKLGMAFQHEISFEGYDHPDHVYALMRSNVSAD